MKINNFISLVIQYMGLNLSLNERSFVMIYFGNSSLANLLHELGMVTFYMGRDVS